MVTPAASTSRRERVWQALAEIPDPEIPAISLVDLGVIGEVRIGPDLVHVELLPTFVGCPAIDVMRERIGERLTELAIADRVEVEVSFATPWTSERISDAGRERLRLSGFAPPVMSAGDGLDELAVLPIAECPYCGSRSTTLENPFGPTLCRAIYHCAECRQPFEQFKRV
ncbi:MAG TPA: 1,2-phenylacetyl-CoA epoxidase subunit PaaD [Candidatus Limnocylindrales bacterium]|nr:1,2-phenylacetyl-CoA epoxidase subunit PaaD [Candidatus Limnocylindrales bacterium]